MSVASQDDKREQDTETRPRTGTMSLMFQKGLKGWIREHDTLKEYCSYSDTALRYHPITQQDLIATGTRDYESAKRILGGKSKDPNQDHKVIQFMSYVAKRLTTIPLELCEGPRVVALHMGYNVLQRIDNNFFRMPVLRELNLDQNELEEIVAEFRYLTTLEILSMKNNKIAHISYHFCALTNIRELSLSHNKLTVVCIL